MVSERGEMSLFDHLTELRRRLVRVAIVVLIGIILAFIFRGFILEVLMTPAEGFDTLPNGKPVYTEMTEMIGITMKISLVSGFILALPVLLFESIMFVAPGLTRKERGYLVFLLPGSVVSFAVGASFGYFVLFPPALNFLLTFGSDVATPMIRIGNYMNLVINLLFWMGIAFEMPLVIFFLAKIGIVAPRHLTWFRRYAVILAFVLGAMITPTFDPINQSLVALPIIVLFEFSILLARFAARGKSNSRNIDLSRR